MCTTPCSQEISKSGKGGNFHLHLFSCLITLALLVFCGLTGVSRESSLRTLMDSSNILLKHSLLVGFLVLVFTKLIHKEFFSKRWSLQEDSHFFCI